MKRAKIMLMGIAVVAVVGGALAFKAKNSTATHFFYSYTSKGGINQVPGCFVAYETAWTTLGAVNVEKTYSSTTAPTTIPSACSALTTTALGAE